MPKIYDADGNLVKETKLPPKQYDADGNAIDPALEKARQAPPDRGLLEHTRTLRVKGEPKMSFLETAGRGAIQGVVPMAEEFGAALSTARDIPEISAKGEGVSGAVKRYRNYRDTERAANNQAVDERPDVYYGAAGLSGLASTLLPGSWGARLIAPAAGATKEMGIIGTGIRAAQTGASSAFGSSEADLTRGEYGQAALETGAGGVLGLGMQGLGSALGASIRAIPRLPQKTLEVITNTPEELSDFYIKEGVAARKAGTENAIRSGLPRYQVARDYEDEILTPMKRLVTEGSKESRDILDREGAKFTRDEIAKIYDDKARSIFKRSEGTITDPQKLAMYNWLTSKAREIRGDDNFVQNASRNATVIRQGAEQAFDSLGMPIDDVAKTYANKPVGPRLSSRKIERDAFMNEQAPKTFSSNRVKDEIQSIDNITDWETTPGRFARVDDTIRKEVRAKLDDLLKSRSEGYRNQMKQVASDTELYSRLNKISTSEGALANVLRRLDSDQYGAGQLPREALEQADKRLGTDFLRKVKLSNAREAFDKSVTNGSMNVNKFANLLGKIPVIGPPLAAISGVVIDKWGRQVAMEAIDASLSAHTILEKEGLQPFLRFTKKISDRASQGNKSAVATMEALQLIQERRDQFMSPEEEAMKRRSAAGSNQ